MEHICTLIQTPQRRKNEWISTFHNSMQPVHLRKIKTRCGDKSNFRIINTEIHTSTLWGKKPLKGKNCKAWNETVLIWSWYDCPDRKQNTKTGGRAVCAWLTSDSWYWGKEPPTMSHTPRWHHCEMEGPQQTGVSRDRTVWSDWRLEYLGGNWSILWISSSDLLRNEFGFFFFSLQKLIKTPLMPYT